MGSCWSSWWKMEQGQGSGSNLDCLSQCLVSDVQKEIEGERPLERKLALMEKKVSALELRLNTTDEANQRLYNKWGTIEERFQQMEGLHQGDLRAIQTRCRGIEQRIDSLSLSAFDRCDDIIIVEE